MTYLLDVSAILALLLQNHEDHGRMMAWYHDKELAICPIVELGFLRVSVLAYKAELDESRKILENFKKQKRAIFLPDSLSALDGHPAPLAKKTTDWYLANLAESHGMKWATLDTRTEHPAAVVI